jgi:dCTP diphosphatase
MREFVHERDWEQFHTPRNLLLALVGEVGELAEIYQWMGEVKPKMETLSEKDKQRTKE